MVATTEVSLGQEAREEMLIANAGMEDQDRDPGATKSKKVKTDPAPAAEAPAPPPADMGPEPFEDPRFDPPRDRVKAFDPVKWLMKIGSADYLEVKWRLVWLRDIDPEAKVTTDLIADDGNRAMFKATVSLTTGGVGVGHGSESYDDFRDYAEKAETKAIGRALAALGFGTQFTAFELDTRLVDTPIDPTRGGKRPQQARQAPQTQQGASQAKNAPKTAQAPNGGPDKGGTTPNGKSVPPLIMTNPLNAASFPILTDKTVPLEEQERRWAEAVETAVGLLSNGVVSQDRARLAWGNLRGLARENCKTGGIESPDEPIPVQRWRYKLLVERAPTMPFLEGLSTWIEEDAAWDADLSALFAKRHDELDVPEVTY